MILFIIFQIIGVEDMNLNEFNHKELYENISIKEMRELVIKSGLDKHPDLESIKNHLDGESIIEIGCGYGRNINWLLDNTEASSIIGVEISNNLYTEARKNISPRLSIIHGNFLDMSFKHSFDAALLLWTGVTDYAKEELGFLFKKIRSEISDNGKLFIDYLDTDLGINPANCTKNNSFEDDVYEVQGLSNSRGYAYIPAFKIIQDIVIDNGFELDKKVPYETTTNKKVIYIFKVK